MAAPPSPPADDEDVVLELHGTLDARAGQRLLADVERATHRRPSRIQIDLGHLAAYTPEGLAALRSCRELTRGLRRGLHYRTVRGPGREAIRAAFGS